MKVQHKGYEYDVLISDDRKTIFVNGLPHKFRTPQDENHLQEIAEELIKKNRQHWNFHHMSEFDQKKTKEVYIRETKGFPHYEAGAAYGYGQVFRYEGQSTGCHKVMSGMTQKLSREITGKLNEAVEIGYSWAKQVIKHCEKELDFEKCLRDYKLLETTKDEKWKEKNP